MNSMRAILCPRGLALQSHILNVIGVVILTIASAKLSHSENAVLIESMWVDAEATNVVVGIYLTNDVPVSAIVIPLEFRSIRLGSFITRRLAARLESRLASVMQDGYPMSQLFTLYHPRKRLPSSDPWTTTTCALDEDGLVWRYSIDDSLPDFVGEEALLIVALPSEDLSIGTDGSPGQGFPSLILEFDVNAYGGAFTIDTTCTAPFNHLLFARYTEDSPLERVVPAFTPSIVLVGCNAECHGDPQCDGSCDIVDLVRSVDVAFKGASPAIDPDPRCPVENTDVNCDMVTDVIDIVKMINVQYRSASLLDEFCVACEHIPRSGNPKEDVRTPYFRNNGT